MKQTNPRKVKSVLYVAFFSRERTKEQSTWSKISSEIQFTRANSNHKVFSILGAWAPTRIHEKSTGVFCSEPERSHLTKMPLRGIEWQLDVAVVPCKWNVSHWKCKTICVSCHDLFIVHVLLSEFNLGIDTWHLLWLLKHKNRKNYKNKIITFKGYS